MESRLGDFRKMFRLTLVFLPLPLSVSMHGGLIDGGISLAAELACEERRRE